MQIQTVMPVMVSRNGSTLRRSSGPHGEKNGTEFKI